MNRIRLRDIFFRNTKNGGPGGRCEGSDFLCRDTLIQLREPVSTSGVSWLFLRRFQGGTKVAKRSNMDTVKSSDFIALGEIPGP